MEAFLDALGFVSIVFLVVVGLLAGWIAATVAGGHRVRYMALGVVGALALPFVLAALGIGVLAAGGLILLLVVAAIGAAIVLAIAKAIFD